MKKTLSEVQEKKKEEKRGQVPFTFDETKRLLSGGADVEEEDGGGAVVTGVAPVSLLLLRSLTVLVSVDGEDDSVVFDVDDVNAGVAECWCRR